MKKIKPIYYSKLSSVLLDPYFFPRKEPYQLCCVVDTSKDLIYPVPVNIEHIDFIELILNLNVKKNPNNGTIIVPSNIIIDLSDRLVKSVVTGVSGAEIGFGVRHTREQLEKAHMISKEFIKNGEFSLADILDEDKIIYRYTIE